MSSMLDGSIKLVIFELASEEFGVDIHKINSTVRMQEIIKVPNANAFIEGILDFRGTPLLVIDLRKKFGLSTEAKNIENMRILIIEFQPHKIGFIVNAVTEVKQIPFNTIEPVPSNILTDELEEKYLLGISNLEKGERLILMLDLANMFSPPEIDELSRLLNDQEFLQNCLRTGLEEMKIYDEQTASTFDQEHRKKIESKIESNDSNKIIEDNISTERKIVQKLAVKEIEDELQLSINYSDEEE
ncbi:chemotaxis protein CheW [Candidatus Lokiarchaeum ossiferum]